MDKDKSNENTSLMLLDASATLDDKKFLYKGITEMINSPRFLFFLEAKMKM